jgi:hypothetical protein
MNIFEKIEKIDRRWIFLGVGVIAIVFYLKPITLPITLSPQSQAFFDSIDSLAPGDIVHLTVDYSPGGKPEIFPMHKAVVRHLLQKDVKIVASTLWEMGVPFIEMAYDEVLAEFKEQGISKEYGVDYVNLGYMTGWDVVMTSLGSSFKNTYPKDSKGNATDSLPLMQQVTNFDDIKLMINFSVGAPGIRQWIQQVQMRFKVRIVCGATGVMSPDLYPFFQSGQIDGFLGGLVGAAEYEKMVGHPGRAMAGMTIQSFVHLFIILLIMLGNIAYFINRARSRSSTSENREAQ